MTSNRSCLGRGWKRKWKIAGSETRLNLHSRFAIRRIMNRVQFFFISTILLCSNCFFFSVSYSISLQMSFVIISFISKKLFNLKEKETRFKSRIFSNLFLHVFFSFLILFSITKFLDRFEDHEIILEMLLEINSRFARVVFNVPFFRVKFRAAWPYPGVIGNTYTRTHEHVYTSTNTHRHTHIGGARYRAYA